MTRKLVTAEQAQQLDHLTQSIEGISAEGLMERAGILTVKNLRRDFPIIKKIIVVVGPGNNGGDGLVMARELLKGRGSDFQLLVVCPEEGASALWKKKKDELLQVAPSVSWLGMEDVDFLIERAVLGQWDLLIDAGFGVGLSRSLNPFWQKVLSFFSQHSKHRIAVDIPSGLNATTGLASAGTLTAHITYTFGFAKLGMLIGDGPSSCGKIKVLNIGFSKEAAASLEPTISFFGRAEALTDLPPKASWQSHKSTRGHLLVLAGSEGMEGAGALAAQAGARMGAGYVTWARWPQSAGYKVSVPPHIMTTVLDADLRFMTAIKAPTAVVIGPGLGINEQSRRLIKNIHKHWSHLPVVVDADALHLLKIEKLYPAPPHWILTPHSGELARLLETKVDQVEANRLEALLAAHKQLGGCVLLKGYRTLVVDSNGVVQVIGSGGPALAKAGSGDVLAGMLGGALAMGAPLHRALCLTPYLHGRIGDAYVQRWQNDFTLVASDLPEWIPHVLKSLYVKKIT